jgi:hypothetical protein
MAWQLLFILAASQPVVLTYPTAEACQEALTALNMQIVRHNLNGVAFCIKGAHN